MAIPNGVETEMCPDVAATGTPVVMLELVAALALEGATLNLTVLLAGVV